MKAGADTLNTSANKLFSQGFELLVSCDSLKCQISMFRNSFDFNTSTIMKIIIFIVIVLCSSVVVGAVNTLYNVYRWIQRSVRIKQLQECLKSNHWLRRYCILSGGAFYFEPPCILSRLTRFVSPKRHTAIIEAVHPHHHVMQLQTEPAWTTQCITPA